MAVIIQKNELFLLEEIVKKNFSSKYKDSVLGIFWSVLRPLLMMIIFTIIFSTLFGKNLEYYPVYILSGRCIFDFFSAVTNSAIGSIKYNKNILEKTAAPKYIFVLGTIISEFLNFLISLIILVVVMIVIRAPFYFSVMFLSIIPILSLIIMCTGLSFILSIISIFYTDIQHLWGVIMLMLMYACAIFYPADIVPEPYYSIMILNPLFWFIDQFRSFIYQGTIPSLMSMVNSLLLSLIVLVCGIIIFKNYEDKVALKF